MGAFIWRVVIGLLIMSFGFLFAWKTDAFLRMLGPVYWAEKHFGGGGTRFFYKLLGTAIIVLGIIVVTDLFDDFMTWLVGGLFG